LTTWSKNFNALESKRHMTEWRSFLDNIFGLSLELVYVPMIYQDGHTYSHRQALRVDLARKNLHTHSSELLSRKSIRFL
jgi:hypothetical protein